MRRPISNLLQATPQTGRAGPDEGSKPRPSREVNRERNRTPAGPQASGHRWSCLLVVGLFALGSFRALAQRTEQEGRWLLAIETTVDMVPRREALFAALESLFSSELDQRLQPGDTLGVWTFDHQVTTGRFPLQTWVPGRGGELARRLQQFLQNCSWQHQGEPGLVLPLAESVSGESARFNLLILCSGERPISGTPFDEAINATLRRIRRDQRRLRQPVIIVLRAENGVWVAHSVGQPPWPLQIPETPGDRAARQRLGPSKDPPAQDSLANQTEAAKPHPDPRTPPPQPPAPATVPSPRPPPDNTRMAENIPRPVPAASPVPAMGLPHEPRQRSPLQEGASAPAKPEPTDGPSEGRPDSGSAKPAAPATDLPQPATPADTMAGGGTVSGAPQPDSSKAPTAADPRPPWAATPARPEAIGTSTGNGKTSGPGPSEPHALTPGLQTKAGPTNVADPSGRLRANEPALPAAPVSEARPVARLHSANPVPSVNPSRDNGAAPQQAAGTLQVPFGARPVWLLMAGLACLVGAGMMWVAQRRRRGLTGRGSLITQSLDLQPQQDRSSEKSER